MRIGVLNKIDKNQFKAVNLNTHEVELFTSIHSTHKIRCLEMRGILFKKKTDLFT